MVVDALFLEGLAVNLGNNLESRWFAMEVPSLEVLS